MNFRDVLITLGQIASPGIGFEFAGVVEAVGADVTSLGVGDRVFGCGRGCFLRCYGCPWRRGNFIGRDDRDRRTRCSVANGAA